MSKQTLTLIEAKATTVAANPIYQKPTAPDVSHLPMLKPDDLGPSVLLQTLAKALTMRRDHGSATEAEFVAWLTNRLPVTMIDAAGNIHVDTRTNQYQSTLFTSHTDSVHNGGGVNRVRVDGKYWRADGAALGADDGAGVALMAHMIERGVPAYYIFFRGEECGGVGSSWLVENMPTLLSDFTHAIAFDRAGYSDVITHQGRGRCCSDTFAEALSNALCDQDLLYMPCDTGVYTDTAEFIEIIPECTNLSVGYKFQHGDREEQDVEYLIRMAEALVQIDWASLPVSRDPAEVDMASLSAWYSDTWPRATNTTRSGYSSMDSADDLRRARSGYSHMDGGTFLDSEDERQKLHPEDWLDGDELDLYWAVEEAQMGKLTEIMDILSDHLYPSDPSVGQRHISRAKLTLKVLERAMNDLELGVDAETVKAYLVDVALIT